MHHSSPTYHWPFVEFQEASVSLRRLDHFFRQEERQPKDELASDHPADPETAICLHNATFGWTQSIETPVLFGLDLQIKKGSLVAVVGHVGTGKSSLLAAILGELHKFSGGVHVFGRVAYVPQQPWIRNATVRENILFGLVYERNRYEEVLVSCALSPDLAILPNGDSTEIGERGINLSGGQKARVALARAVYRRDLSDIYLLDDPLSAVDMNVGNHIFHKCIREALNGKTRLVVLNSHLHNLRFFDRIIVLEADPVTNAGRIAADGTYEELLPRYASLFSGQEQISNKSGSRTDVASSPRTVVTYSPWFVGDRKTAAAAAVAGLARRQPGTPLIRYHHAIDELEELDTGRQKLANGCPSIEEMEEKEEKERELERKVFEKAKEDTKRRENERVEGSAGLTEEEERVVGAVSFAVYKYYFGVRFASFSRSFMNCQCLT